MNETEAKSAEPGSQESVQRVSIGMPVYNGEAYLAEAIEAILAQTFEDFELVISDNASSDRTEAICREYAARDTRIRYYRQEVNLGASPNHRFVFERSRGKYFKWSAHDDVMEPTLIERCVEALDTDPSVQLAFGLTQKIDETGAVVGAYEPYGGNLGSARASERFRDMVVKQNNCIAFFGLGRRQEFATTDLLSPREESDRHLLAELALRGPFREIPEYLFRRRHHPAAYSHAVRRGERMAWWDTSSTEKITFPEWRSIAIYNGLINKTPMPKSERRATRMLLIPYLFGPRWYRQRWVKMLRDAAFGAYQYARRFVRNRSGSAS